MHHGDAREPNMGSSSRKQTKKGPPQKIIIAWIRSIIDVPISPIIFTIGCDEISPLSEPHPTVAPSTCG